MLKMRWSFAEVLCRADGATLGDTREAVAMLEDAGRTARRVLGGARPITVGLERPLRPAQAAPPPLRRSYSPLCVRLRHRRINRPADTVRRVLEAVVRAARRAAATASRDPRRAPRPARSS